ncbi:extracellular solute-binding protein family 1 [Thermoanaerobacter mathranii subsp. mathranii str. A3]|jgi:arabinogalactan oligomer/maltooligosaccharide transport system substrate-binding protein|uniref:Maltodextrin-binding protein n=1 Tax=Thermoanaerobacter mathranii subsp. mathranii (strain DSM 11426 / CCUG 53645 / CIP 108742 / A3) TaxID=583358 RepID=A0ABM5LSC7_THEM3|nr:MULTISPECIES: maltose ABC transporter substrate-binding protein [Thermoanaerobacter]ADH61642.1 extracellular solute-binding protein family 1 [Thermoanaerobacter mathranii subsp. mathranii str. A3]MDK2814558.1 arabinogalactan oligomer / maltooligosaccharide transport system substrate-binding protein [Thermoanaerobacter sp.]
MKKYLWLILILVIFMTFTACAPESQSSTPQPSEVNKDGQLLPEPGAKLLVWESEGPEGEFIQYAAKKFTEKYGVEVVYEPVTHTDAPGKLATDGPAGIGADVFAAPHDKTGELVASGLIQENDLFADRIRNEFMQGAVDAVSFQGVVYGYPTGIETYALFYNKEYVKEPPKTYQDIVEFAKEFNDLASNRFGFMWDVGNAYYSHSFVAGYGGYVFGKGGTDKDDIGLNSKEAVEGAKFLVSLKEILPLKSDDTNYQVMDGMFKEGKAAMIINGPWAVRGYQEAGVDFGIAPLPLLPNGEHPASFSGVRTMFVSAYTKYPNAAKLFADFITSEEMLLKRYEITKQIPPMKSLMNADIIKSDPYAAPFLEQAQFAVPMPSIPQMGVVWEPYARAFQVMWNDGVDPQKALDEAVQTIKDAIAIQ